MFWFHKVGDGNTILDTPLTHKMQLILTPHIMPFPLRTPRPQRRTILIPAPVISRLINIPVAELVAGEI